MKRHLSHTYSVIIVLIVALSACSKSGSDTGPKNSGSKLSINSISTNTGPYTTQVTIEGSGFSATATDNKVFFNGHDAVVDASSSTELLTSVPLAAGTGNITITTNVTTATGPIFTYQVTEVVAPLAGSVAIGSANGVGTAASFFQPTAIAADALGNLYVADTDNGLVRKVTADGTVTTFASGFKSPSGIAVGPSGNIYVSDTYNGLVKKITPAGVTSSIIDASTGLAATFNTPKSLVVDASENIFVVTQTSTLLKITPAGVISTVANDNNYGYYGLVLDAVGNLFSVDQGSNIVFKIMPGGVPAIFAGNLNPTGGDLDGTGKGASFYRPVGLAIDGDGNLLVIDSGNQQLRKITPGAVVTTFGGHGIQPFGPVAKVNFGGVTGVTIDKAGNTYFIYGSQITKMSKQ